MFVNEAVVCQVPNVKYPVSSLQLFVASTKLRYSYVCQPIRHITRPEELQVRESSFVADKLI